MLTLVYLSVNLRAWVLEAWVHMGTNTPQNEALTHIFILTMLSTNASTGILVLIFIVFSYFRRRERSCHILPPGPKKLPLIGNLLQVFDSFDWECYARWGEQYGVSTLAF